MEDGETQFFSPEEISALILVKMKKIAEAFVGKEIKEAVLTVPGETNIRLQLEYCSLSIILFTTVSLTRDDVLTLLVIIVFLKKKICSILQ